MTTNGTGHAGGAEGATDALVLFMPAGRRGRFPIGTPILDAARSLGVYVESVCGGRGICGRCQCEVTEGRFAKHGIESSSAHTSPVSEAETRYAELRPLAAGRRLSCATRVMGDLVVDIPQDAATNRQMVRKRAEARAIALDPNVRLYTVDVDPPDMAHPRGDADRLLDALAAAHQFVTLKIDTGVLPSLPTVLRAGGWRVTGAIYAESDRYTLIGLWPGAKPAVYGIAVDIGSTTIAAHLSDLSTGRTVASAGTTNPQIRFGEDLMSRVSYITMHPGSLPQLVAAVRGAVETLIDKLTGEAGIAREDILEAVFVGNPVMHHIFLGLDPTELGGAPFALTVSGPLDFPARDIALGVHPAARVYVLPCVAGHVGADAAGAMLAEGPHRHAETTLLVDIGTNAEIVLGNATRVLACSSPTGPAFEGAEISCGQRAAPGAVERVRIDRDTLEPRFRVIGVEAWSDEPGFSEAAGTFGVTGLCGSGIVEAIAEMFLAGIITADGVIDGRLAARSPRIVANGRTFAYVLNEGPIPIRVTQSDVRAIQLAKAALYAGTRLLMDRLGVDSVERIKLAGAFGSYIEPKYAMVLGLIPDCPLNKVTGVGNAAGTGARMALVNMGHRAEIEALVGRVEKVETALEPRFQEHFVAAMAFPNKVHAFPHLAAEMVLPAQKSEDANESAAASRPRSRRARPTRSTAPAE